MRMVLCCLHAFCLPMAAVTALSTATTACRIPFVSALIFDVNLIMTCQLSLAHIPTRKPAGPQFPPQMCASLTKPLKQGKMQQCRCLLS